MQCCNHECYTNDKVDLVCRKRMEKRDFAMNLKFDAERTLKQLVFQIYLHVTDNVKFQNISIDLERMISTFSQLIAISTGEDDYKIFYFICKT